MILRDAIKELVHRSHKTYEVIAKEAGRASTSFIGVPLSKNNMQVSTLIEMADICGYDLLLVKREEIKTEFPIKIELLRDENGDIIK